MQRIGTMSGFWGLLGLFALLWLVDLGCLEGPECRASGDCRATLSCVRGWCVSPEVLVTDATSQERDSTSEPRKEGSSDNGGKVSCLPTTLVKRMENIHRGSVVRVLLWPPNPAVVVSADASGYIVVWKAKVPANPQAYVPQRVKLHDAIRDFAFSRDGRHLYIVKNDAFVYRHAVSEEGIPSPKATPEKSRAEGIEYTHIVLIADQKSRASGFALGSSKRSTSKHRIEFWLSPTQEFVSNNQSLLIKKSLTIDNRASDDTPIATLTRSEEKSGLLISGDRGGHLRLWELQGDSFETLKLINVSKVDLGKAIVASSISSDTKTVYAVDVDKKLWKIRNINGRLSTPTKIDLGIEVHTISSVGMMSMQLLINAEDGTLKIWDVTKKSQLRSFPAPGLVRSFVTGAQSRFLFVGTLSQRVFGFDWENGKEIEAFAEWSQGHSASILSLGFSRDGESLYSFDKAGFLLRWSSRTGRLLSKRALALPSSPLMGRLLVRGTTLWALFLTKEPSLVLVQIDEANIPRRPEVLKIEVESKESRVVYMQPHPIDATIFALALDDGRVGVITRQGNRLLLNNENLRRSPLPGRGGEVRSLRFSRDGESLGVVYDANMVRIFDWKEEETNDFSLPVKGAESQSLVFLMNRFPFFVGYGTRGERTPPYGGLVLWEQSKKHTRFRDANISALASDSTNTRLVALERDGSASFWGFKRNRFSILGSYSSTSKWTKEEYVGEAVWQDKVMANTLCFGQDQSARSCQTIVLHSCSK